MSSLISWKCLNFLLSPPRTLTTHVQDHVDCHQIVKEIWQGQFVLKNLEMPQKSRHAPCAQFMVHFRLINIPCSVTSGHARLPLGLVGSHADNHAPIKFPETVTTPLGSVPFTPNKAVVYAGFFGMQQCTPKDTTCVLDRPVRPCKLALKSHPPIPRIPSRS